MDVTERTDETTTSEATFDYTAETETVVVDMYEFTINEAAVLPIVKQRSDRPRELTFRGLQAGTLYTLEVTSIVNFEGSPIRSAAMSYRVLMRKLSSELLSLSMLVSNLKLTKI